MAKIGSIIDHFSQTFSVIRRDAPVVDESGHAYDQPVSVVPMRGAIYPQQGDLVENPPEGMRDRAAIWVYTRSLLRTAEEPELHDADLVRYQRRLYRVYRAEPWTYGAFYRNVALKLPQESGYGPVYFGVGVTGLNAVQILALPGLLYLSSNSARIAVAPGAGQKAYFAAPAAFGTLGADLAGSVTQATISGTVYNVFESTAANLGSIEVLFE